MKIPLSWLKEHIDLTNFTDEQIADAMTEIGFEVEACYQTTPLFQGVVTAQVIETKQHPNADRLTCAMVSDGNQVYPVVCGAPNCREGIIVALARVGASIDDQEGKTWKIKKSKLRGELSHGMLCSEIELGIGRDSSGIIEFPENTPLGTLLEDQYKDTVIEIGLTPNLAHAFCILGVARDLAAYLDLPLKNGCSYLGQLPELKKKRGSKRFKIALEDTEGCPSYGFATIEGVKVGPSPEWLKLRLENAGVRSINNVVDATNYCMLEYGQPLHAFDADKIKGDKVIIRGAQEDEILETLDGKSRNLEEHHLIIADSEKPLALAGVMGGANSEVSDQTSSLLIESAVFDPTVVRKSSKDFFLVSDSSKRFERGVDSNQCLPTLEKVTQLILDIAGGICSQLPQLKGRKCFETKSVPLRFTQIAKVLGVEIERAQVEKMWNKLQFHWTPTEEGWMISVPTYRYDISQEIDLVEEVSRFFGINKIPHILEKALPSRIPHSPLYTLENEVRSILVAERLQEVVCSSLVDPQKMAALPELTTGKEQISVMNPSSKDHSTLRSSLICSALDTIKKNQDHQVSHLACFEIGRVYSKKAEQYEEEPVVSIFLTGETVGDDPLVLKREVDFFDLKGIIQRVSRALRIDNIEYVNTKHALFHPGRQAKLFQGKRELGYIGQVHPTWAQFFDVKKNVYFAQISLKHLKMLRTEQVQYRPLSIYPSSQRDWTITLDKSIGYKQLAAWIDQYKGSHCNGFELISIYEGQKLAEGTHSLSLRFTYQDSKATLKQQVVDKEHMKMVETIEKFINEVSE